MHFGSGLCRLGHFFQCHVVDLPRAEQGQGVEVADLARDGEFRCAAAAGHGAELFAVQGGVGGE